MIRPFPTQTCPICFDLLNQENGQHIQLHCGHEFCKDCIYEYIIFKNDNTACPVCRVELNNCNNNTNCSTCIYINRCMLLRNDTHREQMFPLLRIENEHELPMCLSLVLIIITLVLGLSLVYYIERYFRMMK